MIGQDDLRAAVSAGMISEAQAANLSQLSYARSGARQNLDPGDEPFELFKGFNEIFIVVGLVILAAGWAGVVGFSMDGGAGGLVGQAALYAAVGAALIWGVSEYFIRKRRMVAPAITLSIFWAINAAVGLTVYFSQPFMIAQEDFTSLPLPLTLATLSLVVFWYRFRVPFSMAMIAVGAFIIAMVWAATDAGSPSDIEDLFILSADGPFAWITLALGFVVFIVAMIFDMSDPHRVTRRSAQGFWLHVVAAPALVNTVALSLLQGENSGSTSLLAAFLALFAIVAIIIDRRSFLIAAVGYCVVLSLTLFEETSAAYVVLLLGIVLVLLGAFWERLRAALLSLFSAILPIDRLPPSA